MWKRWDLFKIIRDTKWTFHAKMDSINDRNGRDLTKAEDIKKRWGEYTEELYKKEWQESCLLKNEKIDSHLFKKIWEWERWLKALLYF